MRNYTIAVLLVFLVAGAAVSQSFYAGSSSLNTEILYENTWSSRANAAASSSTCLGMREQNDMDGVVTCGDLQYALAIPYDFTITEIVSSTAAGSAGIDDNSGCVHKLSLDSGSTFISGADLETPSSDAQPTDGGAYSLVGLSIDLNAGDKLELVQGNGTYCAAGSSCVCIGDEFGGHYVIRGYRRP